MADFHYLPSTKTPPPPRHMRKSFVLLFLTLLGICRLSAQSATYPNLTMAKPEEAGFSAERLARIDRVVQQYLDSNWLYGATAIIVHHGKIAYYKGFGYDDITRKTPMPKEEIFRIASQTKAITSVAVMMLYEEGKFLLDDPISKYIPEFKNPRVLDQFNAKDTTYTTVPAKREITIRELLTHTSGISYADIGNDTMRAIYATKAIPVGFVAAPKDLATEMRKLASMPLACQPGERFIYSLSSDVLGYLVEIESGLSLAQFFQTKLFEPLGMKDSYFYIPREKQDRLATIYTEDSLHRLVPAPAKINGFQANYPKANGTYYSGGAGLSSTAYDYAIFLQMLLNGGVYNGHRFLGRNTIRLMTMNQIGDISMGSSSVGNTFGLGFEITTEQGSSKFPERQGTFSWGGYFGTSFWADPVEQVAALFMMQVNPFAYSHKDLSNKFRVLVYQALNE
jgi:CubicO group peptidase (beta-lactamase class C family)